MIPFFEFSFTVGQEQSRSCQCCTVLIHVIFLRIRLFIARIWIRKIFITVKVKKNISLAILLILYRTLVSIAWGKLLGLTKHSWILFKYSKIIGGVQTVYWIHESQRLQAYGLNSKDFLNKSGPSREQKMMKCQTSNDIQYFSQEIAGEKPRRSDN